MTVTSDEPSRSLSDPIGPGAATRTTVVARGSSRSPPTTVPIRTSELSLASDPLMRRLVGAASLIGSQRSVISSVPPLRHRPADSAALSTGQPGDGLNLLEAEALVVFDHDGPHNLINRFAGRYRHLGEQLRRCWLIVLLQAHDGAL